MNIRGMFTLPLNTKSFEPKTSPTLVLVHYGFTFLLNSFIGISADTNLYFTDIYPDTPLVG